jgi:nucleoside-diphosphate-sugar epimerase
VLRLFTVYGPRQRPDMAFARFCAAARTGAPLHVHGDGAQTRDFTYVGDVVEALRAALAAPAATLNVGGGSAASLETVLGLLAQLAGRPLDVRRGPRCRGDVRHTAADVRAARAILGWAPRTALAVGLAAQWAAGAPGARPAPSGASPSRRARAAAG